MSYNLYYVNLCITAFSSIFTFLQYSLQLDNFRLNLPTVKKLHKIHTLIFALAIVLAFTGIMRSDTALLDGGDEVSEEILPGSFHGWTVIPDSSLPPDGKKDTCSIYADTPQVAVPRNPSVGSQTRHHSDARRTGQSFNASATFKDGKIITEYTFISYSAFIGLFPSGTRDFRTRLISLGKLII